MEYFDRKKEKKELSSVKELLVQRNQTIVDREAELNLLRNEEAEKEKKGREMEAAHEAIMIAQAKNEEEKAAMRRRIVELEVLLEEERRTNEIVLDPDVFFNQTISQDPAVLSSTPGRNNEIVLQDVFDFVCNPSGTHILFPVDCSQSLLPGNGIES